MSFALPFLSTDFEKLMLVFCLLFRDSYRTKNYFALGKWNANAKKKKKLCLFVVQGFRTFLTVHACFYWRGVPLGSSQLSTL